MLTLINVKDALLLTFMIKSLKCAEWKILREFVLQVSQFMTQLLIHASLAQQIQLMINKKVNVNMNVNKEKTSIGKLVYVRVSVLTHWFMLINHALLHKKQRDVLVIKFSSEARTNAFTYPKHVIIRLNIMSLHPKHVKLFQYVPLTINLIEQV